MRLLKTCSYDCSAFKNYTTVQYSDDDLKSVLFQRAYTS